MKMSNKFIVEDINKNNQAFDLDTNVLVGFKKAVANGQTRLALEYMTHIVDILASDTSVESPAEPEKKSATKSVKETAVKVD
jgi:hypothetical protein